MSKVDNAILQLLMLLENYAAPIANVQQLCMEYLSTLKLAIFSADDSWQVLTTLIAHACGKYEQAIQLKQIHCAEIYEILGCTILDYWQRNDNHEQVIATVTYIWSSSIITYTPYLVKITGPLLLHYINLYMAVSHNSNLLPEAFLQQLDVMFDTLHQAYNATKEDYHIIYINIQDLIQHSDNNKYCDLIIHQLQAYSTISTPSWCITLSTTEEQVTTAQQLIKQISLPHPLQVVRFINMSVSKEQEVLIQVNFAMMSLAAKLKFLSVLFLPPIHNDLILSDSQPLVDFVPNPYNVGQDEINADILLLQTYGPINSLKDCTHSINYTGPCRMLTCFCQDNTTGYYNAEGQETWFSYSCLVCNLPISKMQHAIRQPILPFGWYGCYCSIDCMCADMENNKKLIPLVIMLERHLLNYGINDQNIS